MNKTIKIVDSVYLEFMKEKSNIKLGRSQGAENCFFELIINS